MHCTTKQYNTRQEMKCNANAMKKNNVSRRVIGILGDYKITSAHISSVK